MTGGGATETRRTRQFQNGAWTDSSRDIIGEAAIAIVVNASAEAVMMATPADLQDFAYGFLLTEGLIETIDQVRELEIVNLELGLEARIWLKDEATNAHAARRRRRAGPVGCGMCGIESLEEAMRVSPQIRGDARIAAADLSEAMRALSERQPMNAQTHAAHAAALYRAVRGVDLVREDIGRHNALDKLVGALACARETANGSAILLTSRVSVELVQKAAFIGAPVLAAISAPSALAVATAERCGLTLCGVVRDNGLEVFTHPHRIF